MRVDRGPSRRPRSASRTTPGAPDRPQEPRQAPPIGRRSRARAIAGVELSAELSIGLRLRHSSRARRGIAA